MIENTLKELQKEYGTEAVKEAAEKALSQAIERKAPAGYAQMIQPDKIGSVLQLIDAQLKDITKAGEAVELAYGERGELKRQITKLQTDIKITEATAFMEIGPDNMAEVEGRKVKLNNGEMRDMYRRFASKDQRLQLAEKQAELDSIEQDLFKAKDRWEEAKEASDLVKAKAYVQANLLKFLS